MGIAFIEIQSCRYAKLPQALFQEKSIVAEGIFARGGNIRRREKMQLWVSQNGDSWVSWVGTVELCALR